MVSTKKSFPKIPYFCQMLYFSKYLPKDAPVTGNINFEKGNSQNS